MDTNSEVYIKQRLWLSCTDYVSDDKKIYFSNQSCNALVIVNKETWEVESMVPFIEEDLKVQGLHLVCFKQENEIYFLTQTNRMHIYDIDSGTQRVCTLESQQDTLQNVSWHSHKWQNKMYLLPCGKGMGLWSIDKRGKLSKEDWWGIQSKDNVFFHGTLSDQSFYTLEVGTGNLTITDLQKKTKKKYQLPDDKVYRIGYGGQEFWYICSDRADIVKWDVEMGESARYSIPAWEKDNYRGRPFGGIFVQGEDVFVVSGTGVELYLLNKKQCKLESVFDIFSLPDIFQFSENGPFFAQKGDKILWTFFDVCAAVMIDSVTMKCEILQNVIPFNETVKSYFDHVLMKKSPIFIDGQDGWDLEKFLYYCENAI